MNYIVVAYYTLNTSYADEMQHLMASLKKFNLPMDIVGIPSQGSWQANTEYKAYFVKQMLIRHYPKDILYLNADARVQQYPVLFDNVNFDLGVYYLNGELISSTVYFANNAKVSVLVDMWIAYCFRNPDRWDQQILQHVLNEKGKDLQLQVQILPPTYCKIFDTMRSVENPVIEQFQASRRFKKEVNEKGRGQSPK